MKIDILNAGNSTEMYLGKNDMLLDAYALLKIINKYKLKFKPKPWITLGFQKSVNYTNLIKNFINKGPILKGQFHTNYNKYGNLLSKSQAYYPSQ